MCFTVEFFLSFCEGLLVCERGNAVVTAKKKEESSTFSTKQQNCSHFLRVSPSGVFGVELCAFFPNISKCSCQMFQVKDISFLQHTPSKGVRTDSGC